MAANSDQEIRRILKLAQNICHPHGVAADQVIEQDDGYSVIIKVPQDGGSGDSHWNQTVRAMRDELQKITGVKGVLVEIQTP